ncbi:hypothetical protein HLK66_22935 [Niallia circulans]|uniref:hypothetical protein n=1 Tax=Niallia circulans TaxID=1397 RepID=UPI00148FFB01|nr:hypothetical protein [Niallia circulans]QJX64213.1 hypothetical protein HLK66_22935 [Niallia circulans]
MEEESAKPRKISAKVREKSAKTREISAKVREKSAKTREISAKVREKSANLGKYQPNIDTAWELANSYFHI